MHKKKGFTLIEIMVVVAIIAILAVLAMFMFMHNLGKGRDGRRKADLDRLRIVFEEYYGNENIFPPDNIISNCGSEDLKPYFSTVPCDPKTNRPYCYVYDADAPVGQNYRILASLENTSDSIISELNCGSSEYCGYETECASFGSRYNYGIASSNVAVVSDTVGSGVVIPPTTSPTPLPSTIPGFYACSSQGVCNNYQGNPILPSCPITWSDSVLCISYCPTSSISARCPN